MSRKTSLFSNTFENADAKLTRFPRSGVAATVLVRAGSCWFVVVRGGAAMCMCREGCSSRLKATSTSTSTSSPFHHFAFRKRQNQMRFDAGFRPANSPSLRPHFPLFRHFKTGADFFSQDFELDKIRSQLFWLKKSDLRKSVDFFGKISGWRVFFILVIFVKRVEKCRFCLQYRAGWGPNRLTPFSCAVDPVKSFWDDLWTSNHQVRQRWGVECTWTMAVGVSAFTALISS
jgi:hypothetical protein